MTTVFVKGLGLIGSSLIRAIKLSHLDIKVIGADQNQSSVNYALNHHLIDESSADLAKATQADFIILATPVSQIIADMQTLENLPLKKDVIVTDVGSTKQTIMQAAQGLAKHGITFIGGHPMAGSHKTGVTAGKANLFENAFYFQVSNGNEQAEQKLHWLLAGTKAKWLTVSPVQHDKIVAQISHLPHIIASGLVNQTNLTFQNEPLGMNLAAGGFKSITRIASADPEMWNAILMNNQAVILQQLDDYQATLKALREHLASGDEAYLKDYFQTAKTSRDKLNVQPTAPTGFFDLFLDLPDQVGQLAKITSLLAEAKIGLVNLQIREIREDTNGILQLTFSNEKELTAAASILEKQYQLVRR
ncbi:prephenate dehydrogenase [Fructilactobacillus frigidiflavus]|uniref:prephenate dehydrogenase n=1 Tax=Fructilactobacillus frigidiflavus TaxID=3242688 RepID=UPI0037579AAD